jgi:hypothetical protein
MALDEEAALATLSPHRAIADELIVAFRKAGGRSKAGTGPDEAAR